MPRIYAKQGVSDEWVFVIDGADLNPALARVLDGMAPHISTCVERSCQLSNTPPSDGVAISKLFNEIEKRIRSEKSGLPQTRDALIADQMVHFSDAACWFALEAMMQLASDASKALRLYSESVKSLAFFDTKSRQLSELLNEYEIASKKELRSELSLKQHVKNASEAAAAANRKVKEKAIDLYRQQTYPSKNNAAEKIAPTIGRSVAVVRGWLRGI